MTLTIGRKYTKEARRNYQQGYRKKKKEEELERKADKGSAFKEFMEHVRVEAMRVGAPSAVMGIYKEMLKLNVSIGGGGKGLSGDELAGLYLIAIAELKEGGYIK